MSDTTIRSLEGADWGAWWALRLWALADHPDAFGSDYADVIAEGEAIWRERFETSRLSGSNRVFGAFAIGGRLIGVAGIAANERRKSRHRMDIWGVYVVPEARRMGTGEALIRACIAHARDVPGVRQVHLTVASHNRRAVALYERCGFARYGRDPRALILRDGREIDEDLMVLMLDR